MGRLILSAFADEYDACFEEQLKALCAFDIRYIEPRFLYGKNVSALDKSEVAEAKRKLAYYGIGVSAIGSPLGKIALSGDMSAHLETAKRVFETANELGTKNIRVFSFYSFEGEKSQGEKRREATLTAMEALLRLAKESGVLLCHENEAGIYGESAEACLDLLESLGGRMRAVFDMGNFTLGGYSSVEAYHLLKKHIEYFHIKDALAAGAIVPAGKGEAKIAEILSDYVSASERDVFVTLEPHLQTFDGLNALRTSTFENPYKYENQRVAFADAVQKFKELLA